MVILFAAACSQTDKKTGESKEEATASHLEKSTVVSFDSGKTTVEDISQAITDAGYEVIGTEL